MQWRWKEKNNVNIKCVKKNILKYRHRKDYKLMGRVPIIKLILVNRGYLSSRKLISKNPGRGKDNRCFSAKGS